MTDRYAVFGHPVEHSLSPRIHSLFAAQFGADISYQAIDPGTEFAAGARRFLAQDGRGFNVTIPFKGEAYDLVNRVDSYAEQAGAVNTVRREADDTLSGFNTDGIGLVRDLTGNQGCAVTERRVLVIGAGGAAAGILGPLLAQDPALLVLANRTLKRARQLAERFDAGTLSVASLDAIPGRFDIVINATSAGIVDAGIGLDPTLLAPGALAYDLMYAAQPTRFMRWAENAGAALVRDGKGMLVEQAAEAFRLWRGVTPHTAPVIEVLQSF